VSRRHSLNGRVSAGGERRGEFDVTCYEFCEEEADVDSKEDIYPRRAREAHLRAWDGRGRGQGRLRAVPGVEVNPAEEIQIACGSRARQAARLATRYDDL